MKVHVAHLEHTDGHDKSYRIHVFAGSVAYWYGKRGAAGSWSIKHVADPRHAGADQAWAKRAKGYREVFSMMIDGPDALPADPAGRARFIATVDTAWATWITTGPGTGGGWLAVKNWEYAATAQPYVAAALQIAADRLEMIDGTLLATIGPDRPLPSLAGRLSSITGQPVTWCPASTPGMDIADVASLAVKLWNPVPGDELAELTNAAIAAYAIAG